MENTQVDISKEWDKKQIKKEVNKIRLEIVEKSIEYHRNLVEKLEKRLNRSKAELKKDKLQYVELRVEEHKLNTEK